MCKAAIIPLIGELDIELYLCKGDRGDESRRDQKCGLS